MDDQSTNTVPWDEAWEFALRRLDDLCTTAFPFLVPMRNLVAQLQTADDLRGLFAITSHATLIISPYSHYPDWFNGRRVVIEAKSANIVRVTYLRNGWDTEPDAVESTYEDSLPRILNLCRTRL